jgi:hypothetical protein
MTSFTLSVAGLQGSRNKKAKFLSLKKIKSSEMKKGQKLSISFPANISKKAKCG